MYSFYIDVNLFAYVFENPSTSTHCWADWPNDRTGTELYATNHFRTLDENYLIFFRKSKTQKPSNCYPRNIWVGNRGRQYLRGIFELFQYWYRTLVLKNMKDEKPFQTINDHRDTASKGWKKKSCYHQMKEINVFMSEKLHNIFGTCTNEK